MARVIFFHCSLLERMSRMGHTTEPDSEHATNSNETPSHSTLYLHMFRSKPRCHTSKARQIPIMYVRFSCTLPHRMNSIKIASPSVDHHRHERCFEEIPHRTVHSVTIGSSMVRKSVRRLQEEIHRGNGHVVRKITHPGCCSS
jgi:hypothetical protein